MVVSGMLMAAVTANPLSPVSTIGSPKLEENKKRDTEKRIRLEALGWEVLTIWQCEIKDVDALTASLCDFLEAA